MLLLSKSKKKKRDGTNEGRKGREMMEKYISNEEKWREIGNR